MSEFVVVIFPDDTKTHQVTVALDKLQAEGGVALYASAVVARDSDGKVSVRKIADEGLGATTIGALIGGLAGLPVAPLAVTIGAIGGAIIGLSADPIHQRDDIEFADKISGELARKKTAIVAEVADDGASPFQALMTEFGGAVSSAQAAHPPPQGKRRRPR
jgi:uncharacterized membrane protein